MVNRYKLTIEYDGTPFYGWQSQVDVLTIQGVIQQAVFSVSGEKVRVYASGRTDAGVHARAQVAHIDLERNFCPSRLKEGLNFYVRPHPIVILNVEAVSEDFHARFSTQARQYVYRIINRNAPLMLEHNRAWWVIKPLNVDRMQQAADLLVGVHDFTSFRSTECQALSPIKTLDMLRCVQEEEVITITAQAPSFLHNQVRVMVGSIAHVGKGIWELDDIQKALAAKAAPRLALQRLRADFI